MTIGELVIDLVLKGGNKSSKELKDVNKGMISVSKGALAAITAIAGVSYGFKMLYDKALQSGTGLNKFSKFTGQSAQELQRWQLAARKSGTSAEAIESSFIGLQSTIAEFPVSGITADFNQFANNVKNFDYSRIEDTFYLMEKVREFANNTKFDTAQTNRILGGIGISPDVIAFMRDGIDPASIPDSKLMSDKQIKSLKDFHVMFSELQADIQKAFNDMLVKVGPKILPQIKELVLGLKDLTVALTDFLLRNQVFDMLKSLIQALTAVMRGDWSKVGQNLAKFGELELNMLRGGAYEEMIKKYVSPVVKPIATAGEAAINSTIEIYQDIKMMQAENIQSGKIQMQRAAREGAMQGATAGNKATQGLLLKGQVRAN